MSIKNTTQTNDANKLSLRQSLATFRRFLAFLWQLEKRNVAILAGLAILNGLFPVATLELLRRVVDSGAAIATTNASLGAALLWLGIWLVVYIGQNLFGLVYIWLNEDLHERMRARSQAQVLGKATRLSLAAFERPTFYDQLHRAQSGLHDKLSTTLENFFSLPSQIVSCLALLWYVGAAGWFFPLILAIGLIPRAAINYWKLQKTYQMEKAHAPAERELNYLGALMTEKPAAAEIRLFGLQEHLLSKREKLAFHLRDQRVKLGLDSFTRFLRTMSLEQLIYAIVLGGVVALVTLDTLTVGYLVAFLGASETFRRSLLLLFSNVSLMNTHMLYIRDTLDYLDLPDEEKGIPGRQLAAPLEIEFREVTFSYPDSSKPVLDGINLRLKAGERLALVGENGAGKTTLAKLLLGLYRPTTGQILVNGVDLSELDLDWWRAQTAAVFQDYVQYELTVRENIGFGNLPLLANTDALTDAAAKSGADSVVTTLPLGYETPLGKAYNEQGRDLSTGQWQKLAIARAYLRQAKVLTLDEPTAALDARAEVEVYRQFSAMSQGRSVLFISHRLGSARLADRIVVLEHGKIVEEGHHNELMARAGRYAQLFSIQSDWYA